MKALILKATGHISTDILVEYSDQISRELEIPVIPILSNMDLKCIESDDLDIYIKNLEDIKEMIDFEKMD